MCPPKVQRRAQRDWYCNKGARSVTREQKGGGEDQRKSATKKKKKKKKKKNLLRVGTDGKRSVGGDSLEDKLVFL